jgi:hypothetical protein
MDDKSFGHWKSGSDHALTFQKTISDQTLKKFDHRQEGFTLCRSSPYQHLSSSIDFSWYTCSRMVHLWYSGRGITQTADHFYRLGRAVVLLWKNSRDTIFTSVLIWPVTSYVLERRSHDGGYSYDAAPAPITFFQILARLGSSSILHHLFSARSEGGK